MDVGTRFEDFGTTLCSQDLLLYYAATLPEARTASGLLGTDRLLEISSRFDASQPETVVSELLHAVSAVSTGRADHDDLTVMLIECTASGVPLRDNLAVPFRSLRALIRRMWTAATK